MSKAPSKLSQHIREMLDSIGSYTPIDRDHSQYLLRYKTKTGVCFAVGRTAETGVRFWVLANEPTRAKLNRHGFTMKESLPRPSGEKGTGSGRNSNLDSIPGFKGSKLDWVKVRTPGEAVELAALL